MQIVLQPPFRAAAQCDTLRRIGGGGVNCGNVNRGIVNRGKFNRRNFQRDVSNGNFAANRNVSVNRNISAHGGYGGRRYRPVPPRSAFAVAPPPPYALALGLRSAKSLSNYCAMTGAAQKHRLRKSLKLPKITKASQKSNADAVASGICCRPSDLRAANLKVPNNMTKIVNRADARPDKRCDAKLLPNIRTRVGADLDLENERLKWEGLRQATAAI
jgi:hypothetical protein